jgi:hypothetical protein
VRTIVYFKSLISSKSAHRALVYVWANEMKIEKIEKVHTSFTKWK